MLCYHTFDAGEKNPYSVSSRRFNEEMRYLAVQKIPVISMNALLDHLTKKTPLPERSVLITIDDGYKTAKDIAWPILQRYGFSFTLFVYPHAISRLRGSLTWDDLRQMAATGVEIHSHSYTHPLMTHPGKPMNKEEYLAWVDHELAGSKQKIELELKRPVTALAYPYGGYSEFIAERVRAAGYQLAFTCDDGDIDRQNHPLMLNRRLVFQKTTPKSYVKYFADKPLHVADLSPKDGERVKDIPKEIQARIMNLDKIQPDSIQIMVDKVSRHWHKVAIDPKTGLMRFEVPGSSKRGYYFVSLVAKDKLNPALQREASWIFIVKRNVSIK